MPDTNFSVPKRKWETNWSAPGCSKHLFLQTKINTIFYDNVKVLMRCSENKIFQSAGRPAASMDESIFMNRAM